MTDALHDGYALECREVTYPAAVGGYIGIGIELAPSLKARPLVLLGRSGSGENTQHSS